MMTSVPAAMTMADNFPLGSLENRHMRWCPQEQLAVSGAFRVILMRPQLPGLRGPNALPQPVKTRPSKDQYSIQDRT